MNSETGMRPKLSVTSFQLKMIALITMIIDHAGIFFMGYQDVDLMSMRVIGRLSFPIYAFLIAEGCHHTRDMKKYILRLFVFALISQSVFYAGQIFFETTFVGYYNPFFELSEFNVFFTLLFGAVSVFAFERLRKYAKDQYFFIYAAALLPFCAAMAVAEYFGFDYGAIGVLLIFTVYVSKQRLLQIAILFAGILALYFEFMLIPASLAGVQLLIPYAGMISLVLIYFYNGQRGKRLKWAFYIAYPAHFVVLGLLYYFLIR
ncbi:MAG: conjugal transfer protein TraX [Clostridiales bacterium]|jgi:hypothetical protein|nr:conjugal transfer protein TraX [Clostridiales bacterium]